MTDKLIQCLGARRSIGPKHQRSEPPSHDVLEEAARAALGAPSHDAVFPARFVEVRSREKLAALFAARSPLPEEPQAREAALEKARSKALKGAACIALVVRTPEDARARAENFAAAGAALGAFLTTLSLRGYAAKTVSGTDFANPDGLYDPAAEMLLAFILCGAAQDPVALFEPRNAPAPLTTW